MPRSSPTRRSGGGCRRARRARCEVAPDPLATAPDAVLFAGSDDEAAACARRSATRDGPLVPVVVAHDGQYDAVAPGRRAHAHDQHDRLGRQRVAPFAGRTGTCMKKLDAIDVAILDALQHDGRLPNVTLAKAVGLSATPCAERVRALESAGMIAGYHADLDPERSTSASWCSSRSRSTAPPRTRSTPSAAPCWRSRRCCECYMVAGGFDYLLKVRVHDMAAYRRVPGRRAVQGAGHPRDPQLRGDGAGQGSARDRPVAPRRRGLTPRPLIPILSPRAGRGRAPRSVRDIPGAPPTRSRPPTSPAGAARTSGSCRSTSSAAPRTRPSSAP